MHWCPWRSSQYAKSWEKIARAIVDLTASLNEQNSMFATLTSNLKSRKSPVRADCCYVREQWPTTMLWYLGLALFQTSITFISALISFEFPIASRLNGTFFVPRETLSNILQAFFTGEQVRRRPLFNLLLSMTSNPIRITNRETWASLETFTASSVTMAKLRGAWVHGSRNKRGAPDSST